jgi:hypothetical protein
MKAESPEPMAELNWVAIGHDVLTDPTFTGWTRQGRPVTNVEMTGVMKFREEQRRKAEEVLRTL